jgi:hypothetical protein
MVFTVFGVMCVAYWTNVNKDVQSKHKRNCITKPRIVQVSKTKTDLVKPHSLLETKTTLEVFNREPTNTLKKQVNLVVPRCTSPMPVWEEMIGYTRSLSTSSLNAVPDATLSGAATSFMEIPFRPDTPSSEASDSAHSHWSIGSWDLIASCKP